MAKLQVVILRPDGTVENTQVDNDFRAMQAIVGGPLEAIFGRVGTLYFNEEGRLQRLPYNDRATAFAGTHLDRHVDLVGTAFIVGPADTEGNDTDVRPAVVDYFTKEN